MEATKPNLHIMPGLLKELETFCTFTQSRATQPYDLYDFTKAANEAIALWLQRQARPDGVGCEVTRPTPRLAT